MKIKILGPTFFGTRQVGLKGKKKITTPADMSGIKLRMPPGDAWQLLGRSLGANPTPMAFAETYTGLQTGAVDGQDNPLPNVNAMKFYEVMSQIVLTSPPDRLRPAVHEPEALELHVGGQAEGLPGRGRQGARVEHGRAPEARGGAGRRLQEAGLEIYAPDVNAFRAHAQKVYLASDEAKEWPKGMIEKIGAAEVSAGGTSADHEFLLVGAGRWLQRRAENVLAALLGVMFFAFMVQIVFRYFFNLPDRLDHRADGRHAGCGWCSGARPSS